MEEAALCAPRLALEFFRNPACWSPLILSASPLQGASDLGYGGQAPLSAENNLREGQASSLDEASDSDLFDGQASKGNSADNSNLHTTALENLNLQEFSTLHEAQSSSVVASDPFVGQATNSLLVASDPTGQAAPLLNCDSLPASSPASSSAAAPASSPASSSAAAPTSSPAIPAIPALLSSSPCADACKFACTRPSTSSSTAPSSLVIMASSSPMLAPSPFSPASLAVTSVDTPSNPPAPLISTCTAACMVACTCLITSSPASSTTSSAAAPSFSTPAIPVIARKPPCMGGLTPSTMAAPAPLSPAIRVSLNSSAAAAPSSIPSPMEIPVMQPLHATFSSSPCIAAIKPSAVHSLSRLSSSPAHLTFPGWDDHLSNNSSSYEWHDEAGLSFASPSSTNAHSEASTTPAIPVFKSTPLRAHALSWQPGQYEPPILFVGDIPLSPKITSSSTNSNSLPLQQALLLPANARQSLASPYSAGLLGKGQPLPCCPLCGSSSTISPRGPPTHSAFGFSPLRGRIVADQARESNALHIRAPRQHAGPGRLSTRPRFKMKGELNSKGNLEPG